MQLDLPLQCTKEWVHACHGRVSLTKVMEMHAMSHQRREAQLGHVSDMAAFH